MNLKIEDEQEILHVHRLARSTEIQAGKQWRVKLLGETPMEEADIT